MSTFTIWSPFIEDINTPDKGMEATLTSADDTFEAMANLSHTDIVRVQSVDGSIDVTVPAMWIGIVN